MSHKWNWLDEFLLAAEAQKQKPAVSVTELLDMLSTILPPDARSKSAWDHSTDPVPPQAKEPPMAHTTSSRFTKNDVFMFACPNPDCGQSVTGRVTYELVPVDPSPTSVPTNELTFKGRVVGVEVKHDCMPRVTR